VRRRKTVNRQEERKGWRDKRYRERGRERGRERERERK
jgi:hypothetical protein